MHRYKTRDNVGVNFPEGTLKEEEITFPQNLESSCDSWTFAQRRNSKLGVLENLRAIPEIGWNSIFFLTDFGRSVLSYSFRVSIRDRPKIRLLQLCRSGSNRPLKSLLHECLHHKLLEIDMIKAILRGYPEMGKTLTEAHIDRMTWSFLQQVHTNPI